MKLITSDDFSTIARAGAQAPADIAVCRASTATPQPGSNGRTIRFVLSDPSVGRDNHVIRADAWQLNNYRTNPVFLFAHDSSQLPIGRMAEIGTIGDRLMGTVEFPEAGTYPFADTVYDLYRSGYLNATSAGWQPLEWSFSKDRNRAGGIDFTKVDALEFSAVPVPALPTALVSARSAGIDTGPLFVWAEKVLDHGDQVLIARSELEALRTVTRPDAASEAIAERRARAAAIREQYRAGQAEDAAIAARRARAAQLRADLGSEAGISLRRALARKIAAELGRPIAGSAL